MAKDTLSLLFGTIKDAITNVDGQQIEQFTGHKIDTVDNFMARTELKGKTHWGRAFLAGVVGGVVAAGVKMIVDSQVAPDTEQFEDAYAEAAVDAAEASLGITLTEQQDDLAEAVVELGMGALIGGVYGLITEAIPDTQKVDTERMMTTAKQLAVPAMGLIPAAAKDVAQDKMGNMAGHVAFMGTLEAVRRTTRYYLEEGV